MQNHIHEFLDFLVVERNLADNTIEAYRRDLKHYLDFLEQNNLRRLDNITYEHIY